MSVTPNAPTVVFFGDSRAADWLPPDLPRFTFINRGVGGQTSTEALQSFEIEITPLRPQTVVVQIGVNDLATLTFYPEQRKKVVATCKNNIQQLITCIRALEADTVLTTIFPAGAVDMFFYSPADLAGAIDEVNGYIHTLAGPNVVIFDAYAVLADDDGFALAEYALDLLHINTAGYEALNRNLVPLLIN